MGSVLKFCTFPHNPRYMLSQSSSPTDRWAPSVFILFPTLLPKPILKEGFDKFIPEGENLFNRFQGPVPLREIYILMSEAAATIEPSTKEVSDSNIRIIDF